MSAATRSEASGYFKLVLKKGVLSGTPVMISFRHPSYEPLNLNVQTGRLETPEKDILSRLWFRSLPRSHGPIQPFTE